MNNNGISGFLHVCHALLAFKEVQIVQAMLHDVCVNYKKS